MTIVNKVFSILLIVFMLVPAHLMAADKEDYTEFGTNVFVALKMNGKPWLRLDSQSRTMYLLGLVDGASLLIAEMDTVPNEKGNAPTAFPALERLVINGFTFFDITEEIDRFYQQSSNRRIPVVDAYRHVLKKFKGASSEELAADQSSLRKKYNR